MISAQEKERLNQEYNAFLPAAGFDKDGVYTERSAAALQQLPQRQTFVYDPASGSKLDFYAAAPGAPLFVWVHGGYWRSSSKDENIFVAPGLVAQGVNVASVDYSLAPSVTIDEIVRQVRQSIVWLHSQAASLGFDPSRIHVGGHSAGGHLVGMLLARDWLAQEGLPEDLIGVGLAISGLFDLEPMRHIFVNEQLKLTDAQIEANSPIRHLPRGSQSLLLATYGGLESSEFARQTRDYVGAWSAASNRAMSIDMPADHHFDIILKLESAGNPLFDTLLAQIRQFHR